MSKCKSKYRGVFNYNRIVTVEYAWAYTKTQAWSVICKRLADRDGVGFLSVMSKFNGKSDNYEITEVT